jgi:prepilin-type processing-associated H-X9-DG protein
MSENEKPDEILPDQNGPKMRKTKVLVVTSFIVAAALLGYFIFFTHFPRAWSTAYRLPCGSNLGQLGKAIILYANDHNEMAPPKEWCDALIKGGYITEETLVCPTSGAKRGQSSYAFNKNLLGRNLSEVNPNTVMVFETRPGWNQVGDLDTLSVRSHKGDGCNILFADAHVSFETVPWSHYFRWEP